MCDLAVRLPVIPFRGVADSDPALPGAVSAISFDLVVEVAVEERYASLTGTFIVPTFSTVQAMASPSPTGATPSGVPVMMISPGYSV